MSSSLSTSSSQSSSSDIAIIIIDGILSIINHRCWHCRSLSQDHVHIQRLCLYFCVFSVVVSLTQKDVFDTERWVWHRKMSFTQKDVFDAERCRWHRMISLTQKDVFDIKRCVWHRGMLMKSSLTFKNSSKFSADVLVNFPLKASMSGCGLFQVWQSYLTILELRSTLV